VKKSNFKKFVKLVLVESENWGNTYGDPTYRIWDKIPRSARLHIQNSNKKLVKKSIKNSIGNISDGQNQAFEAIKRIDMVGVYIIKTLLEKKNSLKYTQSQLIRFPVVIKTLQHIIWDWAITFKTEADAYNYISEQLTPKIIQCHNLIVEIVNQIRKKHFVDVKDNIEKFKLIIANLKEVVSTFFNELDTEI
jgi:hypothetical protein